MKKLNNYKNNYLLISAGLGFSTFIIIYYFLSGSSDFYENPTRLDELTNFKIFLFSALLLAPIFEELIFRGYFTKNKILKFITIIGLPLFALSVSKYHFFLSIPYVSILFLIFYKKIKTNKNVVFYGNALLFSIVHYEIENFNNLITIAPILAQFSMGLFLIWIVINFNLKTSIIAHLVFNGIVIFPTFISLQYPNTEFSKRQIEGYEISWRQTPIFGKNTLIKKPSDYEVQAKNVMPLTLYKVYNTKSNNKLRNSELFSKYNISLKAIDNSAEKLDSTLIKTILLEAKLVAEIKGK
jgi:membrane protease YdiL (CAAX protease family)